METRSHPRPRRRMLTVVVALTIAILASTVGLADAQVDGVQVNDAPVDTRPASKVETLRLKCAVDVVGDQRGVLCQWSEAKNRRTRAYQLYRIVDGSPRELLTTVGRDGRRAYFDTDVSAPSSLVYGVISLNRSGRLIGRSAPVHIHLGDDIQRLRLACAPDSIEGERGILCQWSETTQPEARRYLVYRAVGTDGRELIAEIPIDGRQAHFDTDVIPGEVHTYAVLAVDGDGDIVAQSRARRVRWPKSG